MGHLEGLKVVELAGGENSALSGLERLQAGLASSGDRVPFSDLIKMRVENAQPSEVTAAADFPAWATDLLSASLPGPIASLADLTGGFSVLTTLPAGRVTVTTQLRVDFVGAIASGPGQWSCHATCVHATGEVGLSHGEVRNPTGDLIGRSTVWAMVIDAPSPGVPTRPRPGAKPGPAGAVCGSAGSLLERAVVAELGAACLEAEGGRSRLYVPPREDLANSVGSMHGGAIALLGDFAGAVALASLDVSGLPWARRLWMQVEYLRPVIMGDGGCEVTAFVSWRSKRLALVDGEVTGPGGATSARIRQAALISQPFEETESRRHA
jgi:uncharacterized protein (TIGR00369 family)